MRLSEGGVEIFLGIGDDAGEEMLFFDGGAGAVGGGGGGGGGGAPIIGGVKGGVLIIEAIGGGGGGGGGGVAKVGGLGIDWNDGIDCVCLKPRFGRGGGGGGEGEEDGIGEGLLFFMGGIGGGGKLFLDFLEGGGGGGGLLDVGSFLLLLYCWIKDWMNSWFWLISAAEKSSNFSNSRNISSISGSLLSIVKPFPGI